MSYRWIEHTAEMQMELEAPTEEDVFRDALLGLAELLGEDTGRDRVKRHVALRASSRELLLVCWLDEFVYLAETADLLPEATERLELSGEELAADVRFRRGTPRPLVKGVTYHDLVFEPSEGGIHARVVFDV